MQKKPKKPIKKIGKFIREVSVVVIGIAIAVSINGWISSKNERNSVDAFLQTVRLELEENLSNLQSYNEILALPATRYANYLISLDGQPASLDSLRHHLPNVLGYLDTFRARTHAFEMFKFSGYMRLIDPDLQLALWEVYTYLNETAQFSLHLRDIRWEEIKRHNVWRTASDEELVENPPLYDYFVHLQMHTNWASTHRFMTESIKRALAKF